MTSVAPNPPDVSGARPRAYAAWATWRTTILLILAVTLVRILYLAFLCPYTLVEDEAHYWEWSRRLAWSYYSKGPGVAWIIAASTWLGRTLGAELSEFWVRLPAAVFGGVLLLGVAGLTRSVVRDARAAFLAVVCILLMPAFQVASLLMTIDVPYSACWALSAWAAYAALRRGSRWAWLGLGAALGAGFLFKYTILLLLPGLIAYAIIRRRDLTLAKRWGAWALAGGLVFALGLLPVLIWNAQHDWPTVRHLLGHLGLAGGDTRVKQGGDEGWRWSPAWPLEFLAAQLALIGPLLVVFGWSWVRAWRARERTPEQWSRLSFLVWCAAPILGFYLCITFIAEAEGNWPLAGYISLAALAGWGVLELQKQWAALAASGSLAGRWWLGTAGTPARMAWRISIFFGVIVAVATIRIDRIAVSPPMQALESGLRAAGIYDSDRPLIPLGRIMGGRTVSLAAEVLRREVAGETGQPPLIIAQQYGRASQLAFYMPGRPLVYCSSAHSDGRRTQYDMWPETDLDNPALLGRPAICVGGQLYQWEPAFEEVREYGMLEGEPKASRLTFIGLGYRGFPR